MWQIRFLIDAFEFEDRKGGERTIILHGRFTGELSCLYSGYVSYIPDIYILEIYILRP